jgi:hypothetical protein
MARYKSDHLRICRHHAEKKNVICTPVQAVHKVQFHRRAHLEQEQYAGNVCTDFTECIRVHRLVSGKWLAARQKLGLQYRKCHDLKSDVFHDVINRPKFLVERQRKKKATSLITAEIINRRWHMNGIRLWINHGRILAGKQRGIQRKTCPSATLPTTDLKRTGKRPRNCFRY